MAKWLSREKKRALFSVSLWLNCALISNFIIAYKIRAVLYVFIIYIIYTFIYVYM